MIFTDLWTNNTGNTKSCDGRRTANRLLGSTIQRARPISQSGWLSNADKIAQERKTIKSDGFYIAVTVSGGHIRPDSKARYCPERWNQIMPHTLSCTVRVPAPAPAMGIGQLMSH